MCTHKWYLQFWKFIVKQSDMTQHSNNQALNLKSRSFFCVDTCMFNIYTTGNYIYQIRIPVLSAHFVAFQYSWDTTACLIYGLSSGRHWWHSDSFLDIPLIGKRYKGVSLVILGATPLTHQIQSTFQAKSFPLSLWHHCKNVNAPYFAGKPNAFPCLLEVVALASFIAC